MSYLQPDPGQLRHTIVVERVASTPDGAGGFTRSWSALATVRAQVLPTGGREALLDQALQSSQGYKVTIRGGVDVKATDRLRWTRPNRDDVVMNVTSAADPDGRGAWLVIFADAGVVT